MLMNDTTYLLDESMVTLKSIRELQDLMDNVSEWTNLPRVSEIVQQSCVQQRKTEHINIIAVRRVSVKICRSATVGVSISRNHL